MKLLSSRTPRAVAAVLILGIAASSCGDDDDSSSDPTTAPATAAPAATNPAAATTAPAESGAPAAGDAAVMTAETDLGTILVDAEGMTLYMFTPDEQGPSVCEGECLAAWPALIGPATAGGDADESMLDVAARPDDGREQVTYDGWPLYYFGQDLAPGDINGQGLNDKWYVVDPSGTPIGMDDTATTDSTSSSKGDGY